MTTSGLFKSEQALLDWFNNGPDGPERSAVRLEGIVKGGSVRRFYRLCDPAGESLGVLMEYSRGKEENNYYVAIASFLADLDVPVPQVLYHDPDLGLAWLQDFGKQDLFFFKGSDWGKLKDYYTQVLQSICPLWRNGVNHLESFADLPMMKGFDSQLYTWERNYFFDQCVSRFSDVDSDVDRRALHEECSPLQEVLLQEPASLVHRDFQSHNIMMRKDGPGFIDFQGMRQGSWFYDLASLIYDPYMDLSESQRSSLVETTHQMMDWKLGMDAFEELLDAAAIQRLMQALGAYGYLGESLGKREFLDYIPVARRTLLPIAERRGLECLKRLLADVSISI
ncbi:MAG: phosphotransferase [Verrucomicrobiota bacterium]